MSIPPPLADRVAVVTAAKEQRWNAAAISAPVQRPAWRAWLYREPAVVLGRAQRDWAAGRNVDGVEFVARAAGGGAVLAGPWMIGVSAAMPVGHALVAGGVVPSYRWFGEALAQALRRCDVDAMALSPDALRTRRAGLPARAADWACFGSLSPWEVVVAERKIAGLAQVRRREGVLLVAGLLLSAPPWHLLCSWLGQATDDASRLARATTDLAREQPVTACPRGADALLPALAGAVQAALSHSRSSEPGR